MINRAFLTGLLTKDPCIKHDVCEFTIVTRDKFKDRDGEYREDVIFHPCIIFGKAADLFIKLCRKNNMISLEGKLVNNFFTTTEGKQIQEYRILVNTFVAPANTKPKEVAHGLHQDKEPNV